MSTRDRNNDSRMEEKRRLTIARALDEIRGLDLKKQAEKGAFTLSRLQDGRQKVIMPSFDSALEIIMPSGEMVVPAHIDSLTMRVLALRYIKLSCDVPESGEWIAYRDLPGGRFYAATLVPTVEKPLAEAYGRRHGALGKAARGYGAKSVSFGDESYIFHAFPRVPLLLVMHWGDEEFEPEVRILFDSCCQHYLNTDDLKVLASQLAAFLLRRKGEGKRDDNLLWMVE